MNQFFCYDHPQSDILVFDSFLVSQIQEGATVDESGAVSIQYIIDKHFKDRPWVYISNRVASYAVKPLIYDFAATHENLKGIAIVVSDKEQKESAEFEKNFASMPIVVVNSLVDAFNWGKKLVVD